MNISMAMARNNKRTVYIISATFLLLSLVCLIINYSINNSINWSLYPIGGLIVIWATLIPFLILNNYKTLGLFAGLTFTLVPYVFLIQNLVSVKGWFIPLALPILVLSLIAFGVSLIALTNKKMNGFYVVAIMIFLFGVVVNLCVGVIIHRFLTDSIIFDKFRVSTISLSVVLTLVLMFIGYFNRKQV